MTENERFQFLADMQFWLLERGVAATPNVVKNCQENRGECETPVRKYRLATVHDLEDSVVHAYRLLLKRRAEACG